MLASFASPDSESEICADGNPLRFTTVENRSRRRVFRASADQINANSRPANQPMPIDSTTANNP